VIILEKQSITFSTNGFNVEAFKNETTALANDDLLESVRVFKDPNNLFCFEFVLVDQEISLEDDLFCALVRIRCEEYLNLVCGLAYRQVITSMPLKFRLSHACCRNNLKMIFESAIFSTEFVGICGLFSMSDYIDKFKEQPPIFSTIVAILKTDNPTFKYLLLYEVLQSSIGDQSQTDCFIRSSKTYKTRSLKEKDCGLRTSDSKRQGKKETEISYIRNAFAHPEASRADALNSYTNAKLDEMTKTLIELIYEKNGCLGTVLK